ncbi:alpha/beta fold hydrolase [Psychrobacter jeotgali]|uniref:alpha/beta fold hydrolase n=1 Tax=Psychrobacter jeotgali TaxID=179010 RepID=UPI00191A1812|nr:alpha/beta hydrolase [Psychrobacter jeotgali]
MEDLAKSIIINDKQARYYDLSSLIEDTDTGSESKNPPAHFYGGNGFTVGTYEPLLKELAAEMQLSSLAMRGYWYDKPTDKIMTRKQDADTLIEFLEQTQDKPVIGIGHSQGASATAIAAAKRPDLFSQLYLIDPVTFTKAQAFVYGNTPRSLLMTQEPFKSTRNKQINWDSVDDYYKYLRKLRAFRRISDEHLYTFANNSLVKKDEGRYSLLFEPEFELASYFGTPYITNALKQLNKTNLPYTLVLGKPSVFNSVKVRRSWQGVVPSNRLITLSDYGHLLPMEAPKQCANIIHKLYHHSL